MTEEEVIARTGAEPVTRRSLVSDLRVLGVPSGSVVLAHSSLSAIGWVAGGAHAVVLALEEAVGDDGTLVMPTMSGDFSEPSQWHHPPVPAAWWPFIRSETPAFDEILTPPRRMGAIAECFRHQPGTRRSPHPTNSFAARGPEGPEIVGSHPIESGFGERSPLARIYDLDGFVLLLGVGHGNNSSLHLAEYRAKFSSKSTEPRGGSDPRGRRATMGRVDGPCDPRRRL